MEVGTIQQIDINTEMRSAYLDYAMSVIISRALPDARDGLKPVHRRILYAMNDLGMRSNTAYKKSARIVGEVLGKYHPHGDSAVYDAMARMAQDFSMRYMLIDGQGNFGSIHGDSPAAMRYTEARMSRMAEEMLVDLEKNTVDFTDNFDGSLQEPIVLPARLPNLLLNGSSGIAVGMATNIPPHNLVELSAAINYLINRDDILTVVETEKEQAPEKLTAEFGLTETQASTITKIFLREEDELLPAVPDETYHLRDEVGDASVEELMVFVKGPDFPTGGIIVGSEGVRAAYSSGRGRIVVRGEAHIEEMRSNRYKIVISEVPYQTNITSLIERIAALARSGRLPNISDLRDGSDRTGLGIVIELKRGAQPRKVLNRLYKYTQLQSTFGVQLLALVNGEPRMLSLKRSLRIFVEHRQEVITRRTQYLLDKARARSHILEGLLIALSNLDAVIKTIRESPNVETARTRLMTRFNLSEVQARAILDMQLRRLAALERQKIEAEYREVSERIEYLEDLLAHPKKILSIIQEDLQTMVEKYGDERRTRIAHDLTGDLNEEDLVRDEATLVSITQRGYIKRVAAHTYRTQSRGGRGVKGLTTKDEDEVIILMPARSLHTILFFSDKGKVYSEKAYQIPDAGRTARGIPIVNLLALEPGETITAAVSVPDFDKANYCTLLSRKGRIKRVDLSHFASVRPSGLIAIRLDDDDSLGWVRLTHGNDEIIIVTEQGQALRFSEHLLRPMGRPAAGVRGIRIRGEDLVTSMEVVEPNGDLLIVTTGGYGKRTPLDAYSPKGRGTMGVKTMDHKSIPRVGKIASARVVQDADHLTIMSTNGVIIRTKVAQISIAGRATMGVRLMNLQPGDSVASVARIAEADLRIVEDNSIPEETPPQPPAPSNNGHEGAADSEQ